MIGDLNGDGKEDAIVHYGCGFKGNAGNASAGEGWAVWINRDNKLEFLLKDEDTFNIVPLSILSDGTILCEQYTMGPNDVRYPTVRGMRKVRLKGNSLVIIE